MFYDNIVLQNCIYNFKYIEISQILKIKKKQLYKIALHILIIKFQIVYNIFKHYNILKLFLLNIKTCKNEFF